MRPHSKFQTHIQNLQHDLALLVRATAQIRRDYQARKFNPDQPRVPAETLMGDNGVMAVADK